METLFERYRNLVVLLVLLLVQILGLAMQVHRSDAGHMSLDPRDSKGVRLIRLWANGFVSPPERFFHGISENTSGLWHNYFDLRQVREQNQELQQTVDRLRLEEAALLEDAKQGERLQAMLKFQEKYIYSTVAAQVIGTSGSDLSHVFYIDKGSEDKLERDMAVITSDGIVGKVRDVFPHSAQVLVINDQTSGAGVILETTRIRGILRGNALGQPEIVGLMADSRIQPGERVLTAGGDEIFPRGLPVGTVEKVVRDPDQDGFIQILVKPAAQLDRLDEVLVITSTQPRFPDSQQKDIATSESEMGGEAAEEEQQKKASEILAERLPGLMEPNLPADQQPLNDDSNPNPVTRPAAALHPDRFSPDTTTNSGLSVVGDDGASTPSSEEKPAAPSTKSQKQGKAAAKPQQPTTPPQRNP